MYCLGTQRSNVRRVCNSRQNYHSPFSSPALRFLLVTWSATSKEQIEGLWVLEGPLPSQIYRILYSSQKCDPIMCIEACFISLSRTLRNTARLFDIPEPQRDVSSRKCDPMRISRHIFSLRYSRSTTRCFRDRL